MKRISYWLIGLLVIVMTQAIFLANNHAQERQDEEFIYSPQGMRNPFAPLFVPTPTMTPTPTPTATPVVDTARPGVVREDAPTPTPIPFPDLTLNGVFYDEKQPMALINGQLVRQGDWIGRAQVTKIERESVQLKFEGKYSFSLVKQQEMDISIQ